MSEPTSQITTASGPLARAEVSPKHPGLLSSRTSDPTPAKNHSTAHDQVRPKRDTLFRSTPAHGAEQSATSHSLGQTRWQNICARFTVWNLLHQVGEVRTMGQETRQETARALCPTRQTLCSFQDSSLGNDSSLTSLMSLDQSSDMVNILSRRIPGALRRCRNSRGKTLRRTKKTIRILVHPFPARMIPNLRVSPRTCGSYVIHRRV